MKLIFYNPESNLVCTLLSGFYWDGVTSIPNVTPTALLFHGWELVGEL